MDDREQVYKLDLVRKIQTRFPNTLIGGSVSIFLHGVDLQRDFTDLDLVSTEDISEQLQDLLTDLYPVCDRLSPFFGSCDFDTCLRVRKEGEILKVDLKVVEKLDYEIIERGGFPFKVAPMSVIMKAKKRYAEQGSTKHIQDLEYIFRHSINRILDLPLDIPYEIKKETVESELLFPF